LTNNPSFFFPKEPKRLLFSIEQKEAKKLVTASLLRDVLAEKNGHAGTASGLFYILVNRTNNPT